MCNLVYIKIGHILLIEKKKKLDGLKTNIRCEIIKFLEVNTGNKLFDIGLDSDFFLDITPEANLKK